MKVLSDHQAGTNCVIDTEFDESEDEVIPSTLKSNYRACTPEVNLWTAVIREIFRGGREEIQKYLICEDFRIICTLIGVNPQWIKRKYQERNSGNPYKHHETINFLLR